MTDSVFLTVPAKLHNVNKAYKDFGVMHIAVCAYQNEIMYYRLSDGQRVDQTGAVKKDNAGWMLPANECQRLLDDLQESE